MYLYHQVPPTFFGWELVPLNHIKRFDYGLYKKYLQKYDGREDVIRTIIPKLNCVWSDVIFLTAISPEEWRKMFDDVGHRVDTLRFYEIPLEKLDLDSTVVMNYNAHEEVTFSWFYPRNITKIGYVPDKARTYFKETYATGELPFWHHLVPQILYRGTLNISGVRIITV